MNHKRVYSDLIITRKALCRTKSDNEYYENHHILPRCMGGNNDNANLVLLTAREHYIAHKLLYFIYKETKHYYKISCAYIRMRECSNGKRKYSAKDYEHFQKVQINTNKRY